MKTMADQYYLKAIDLYPSKLSEIIENLNYALSYDNDHAGANFLMGKLYCDQLCDYAQAEHYYKTALACDPYNPNICLDYVVLLIIIREFDQAEKLIEYSRKLKYVDLSKILYCEGLKYEYQRQYDEAILSYEEALLESYNEEYTLILNGEVNRAKAKQSLKTKFGPGKKKSRKW